jgi:hypothetical protein
MDPTKLVSHFSEFSVIFYAVYKNQQFNLTIGVYLLRKGPWKDLHVCNVAPRGGWPARDAGIRRGRRSSCPGKGWRRVRGPPRAGLGHWTGWKEPPAGGAPVTRGGGRRGCYWPERVARETNRRGEEHPRVPEGVLAGSIGKERRWAGYLPWRPLLAPAAMRLAAGERWPTP